jgi:hypothetical protein
VGLPVTLSRLQLQGWRQRGYEFGRVGRGVGVDAARRAGTDAAAAYVQGRRAGERESDLVAALEHELERFHADVERQASEHDQAVGL